MKMKRTKRWLVVGITVVTLAAVSVGVVSANGGGMFGGKGRADDAQLGTTGDELSAARGGASEHTGEISEEQLALMEETREALSEYIDREAISADILGITVDELAEKSLNEWLTELGIDRADYMDQMQAAVEAAIADAVADGVITQEQADAMGTGMMGSKGQGGRGGQMAGEERPEFDGERPEFDGERPEFDGERPEGEGGARRGPVDDGTDA